MGDHVRVLQARRQARAVDRRHLCLERARDRDEDEGEEGRDRADDRHDPRDQVTQQAAVEDDRQCAVAAEHKEPQKERAFLPAPERGQRVERREVAARVRGDVDEAEVVVHERERQHDRRDRRREEAGDQRVPCRVDEAPALLERSVGAGTGRIDGQPEADDERGPPEVGHALRLVVRGRRVLARALRRHLARDERAALEVTGEIDVAPGLEQVGDRAAVDDRDERALALDVAEREAEAAAALRVTGDRPPDRSGRPRRRDSRGCSAAAARSSRRRRPCRAGRPRARRRPREPPRAAQGYGQDGPRSQSSRVAACSSG